MFSVDLINLCIKQYRHSEQKKAIPFFFYKMHELCCLLPEKRGLSDKSPSLAAQAKCCFRMIHTLQLHKHFACTDDERLLSKMHCFSGNTVYNTPFFASSTIITRLNLCSGVLIVTRITKLVLIMSDIGAKNVIYIMTHYVAVLN